jgi:hypothetical protein
VRPDDALGNLANEIIPLVWSMRILIHTPGRNPVADVFAEGPNRCRVSRP